MRPRTEPFLAALAERRTIRGGVALIVAHADDETLAAGGSLYLFRQLLLVHVTDSAPRRLDDAARQGFESPADYARARAGELEAALAISGAAPARASLNLPDQEASAAISSIAATLRALFLAHDIRHVVTHAYEGGHPDHDAVAMAVHLAEPAEIVEFAGYHASPQGGMRTGVFLQSAASNHGSAHDRAINVPLSASDLKRKQSMLACFRTQSAILRQFDPAIERFRPAPDYDFDQPPHAGRLLYEEWGWMSGERWRQQAASARCAA